MNYNFCLVLICCVFSSCTNRKKDELQQVEFLQMVSKDEKIGESRFRDGYYYTFRFFQNFYLFDLDTCDYSRALYITFPVTDSSFSFKQDSSHYFIHSVSNIRGELPTPSVEEITEANITGKLIESRKWEITAKTKYFDFKRIITVLPDKVERETIRL